MLINITQHETNRRARDSLKITPISVKITNWLMTKNAKYRAITERSNFECVRAPMY
jgi:hypothetical protein